MSNYTDIAKGLRVSTQIPLDKKLWIKSKSNLNLDGDNSLAFSFYFGMRVYCAEEKETYEWRPVSGETTEGLLSEDFVYPNPFIVNGVSYGGTAYNFFKVMAAEDIDLSNYVQFEDIENFITLEDIPPVTGQNIGDEGIGIYSTTEDNTLKFKKISSSSLNIEEEDSVIYINTPVDENSLSFYVNSNFTGSVSDGSILKPFKTLDTAIQAFKGTGTNADPQYKNKAKIILLSNVTTDSLLNVNFVVIEGGNFNIEYTGTTDYWYNSETIKTFVGTAANGTLNLNIRCELNNVKITSTKVGGILKNIAYKSPTISSSQNDVKLTLNNVILEDASYINFASQYSQLTQSDNTTPITIFGNAVLGETVSTTNTPVASFEGTNWNGEGGVTSDTLTIYGCRNTLLNLSKTTFVVGNKLRMTFNNTRVSVRAKVGGLYQVKPNLSYIKCTDSYFRTDFIEENNTYAVNRPSDYTLVPTTDKMFDVSSTLSGTGINSSTFVLYGGLFSANRVSSMFRTTTDSTLNLLDVQALEVSSISGCFIHNSSGVNVAPACNINVEGSKFKNVISNSKLNIYASDATINNYQFSTSPGFSDDATALANGLIVGNIYYNTAEKKLVKIM